MTIMAQALRKAKLISEHKACVMDRIAPALKVFPERLHDEIFEAVCADRVDAMEIIDAALACISEKRRFPRLLLANIAVREWAKLCSVAMEREKSGLPA